MNNRHPSNPQWVTEETFPPPIEKPTSPIIGKSIPPRVNDAKPPQMDKPIPAPISKVTFTGKRSKE